MNWSQVRAGYPDQWVKLKVTDYQISGDKKIIEEMEVLKTIADDRAAGRELGQCAENEVVYHTSHQTISLKIKNKFGLSLVD